MKLIDLFLLLKVNQYFLILNEKNQPLTGIHRTFDISYYDIALSDLLHKQIMNVWTDSLTSNSDEDTSYIIIQIKETENANNR